MSLLLAGAPIALASCSTPTNAQELTRDEQPESFPVASPKLTDAVVERSYVAEVRATHYAQVRSRIPGIIQSVSVDEGQTVKSDQLLFSLAAQNLKQSLRQAHAETNTAQAALQIAKIELSNTQPLFDKGVVSEAVMALAKSKVESLEAKIEEAKEHEAQAAIHLTYSQIRAPFDGTVNRLHHRVGSLVAEDDLLTTITNTDEVFVYFNMSERDFLEYKANETHKGSHKVFLQLADGTRYPYEGVVDAVESEFDRDTGNIAFRTRFKNPDGILKHGSSGKVIITSELSNVLVIPQKSTFEVQGDMYVYVLNEGNVPHAQRIVPQVRLKDTFVVGSGLDKDARFILEGSQRVKEGVPVGVLSQG